MEPTLTFYEVGGHVRDSFMGVSSKDIDYSVEITGLGSGSDAERAYRYLSDHLRSEGYDVFKETPDKFTIRAKFPQDHPLRHQQTADFVLCRREGPYLDGRRPSYVKLGTLYDDLARRDFTVNAMARPVDSDKIIDPFDGRWDCRIKRLRFVGDPMDRLREDGVRLFRAMRFKITRGFEWSSETRAAICDPETATLLDGCSTDTIREELERCFHFDTLGTLDVLYDLPDVTREKIFGGNLRLSATQKRDMVHA